MLLCAKLMQLNETEMMSEPGGGLCLGIGDRRKDLLRHFLKMKVLCFVLLLLLLSPHAHAPQILSACCSCRRRHPRNDVGVGGGVLLLPWPHHCSRNQHDAPCYFLLDRRPLKHKRWILEYASFFEDEAKFEAGGGRIKTGPLWAGPRGEANTVGHQESGNTSGLRLSREDARRSK